MKRNRRVRATVKRPGGPRSGRYPGWCCGVVLALALAGCGPQGGAMLYWLGIGDDQKVEAEFTLGPGPLLILVDDPEERLTWGDGMGNRIFTLRTIGNQLTNFSMSEKIGGPLFPLFAKMIPPFDESFEQFARDLKTEAETISKTK